MRQWKLTRTDTIKLNKIFARFLQEGMGSNFTKKEQFNFIFSLKACHAVAQPLNLDQLLIADIDDIRLEIFWIHLNLDRTSWKLKNNFLPKFRKGNGHAD